MNVPKEIYENGLGEYVDEDLTEDEEKIAEVKIISGTLNELEKMFNCNIEFVDYFHPDAIDAMRTGILAGEAPFDLLQLRYELDYVPGMAMEGWLHPLDEYIGDHDEFYSKYPPTFQIGIDQTQVKGTTYLFESVNYVRETAGMMWNIDLFEEEDLPNLYELYEAGEWTWDAMRDIAIDATRDTTADGEIDQWGLDLLAPMRSIHALVHSNNGRYIRMANGRVEYAFDEPEVVETLEFLQELYDMGVAIDNTMPEWGGVAVNPELDSAMRIVWTHMAAHSGFLDAQDDRWGVIPIPKGPEADEHVSSHWVNFLSVIPITVENPDEVIEVAQALWEVREPYIEDIEAWEEDYWYEYALAVPDRESLENLQWIMRNKSFLQGREAIIEAGFQENIWEPIRDDGSSPSAVLAEIRPEVQVIIDDIYN